MAAVKSKHRFLKMNACLDHPCAVFLWMTCDTKRKKKAKQRHTERKHLTAHHEETKGIVTKTVHFLQYPCLSCQNNKCIRVKEELNLKLILSLFRKTQNYQKKKGPHLEVPSSRAQEMLRKLCMERFFWAFLVKLCYSRKQQLDGDDFESSQSN